MNTIKGINKSEQRMLKAIQRAVRSKEDGLIGTQMMSDIAVAVGAECWPLTMTLFNMPVIICKDIAIHADGKGTQDFANSISGVFSDLRGPQSILVNDGMVLHKDALHASNGKPETVIYRLESGDLGMKRCMDATQLPADTKWAVGGMGLLTMFQPVAEGFNGAYSAPLRKTAHTVLGVKNGMIYLIMCRNMNSSQVNQYCRDKLKLQMAIMLDGGDVASINGEESSARINTAREQQCVIQAI